MKKPENVDHVVILGAGSTGLGVGLGLAMTSFEGNISIIEKNSRPGGLAGSFNWNGNIIDFGPHRLAVNIPIVRILAEEILGPECLMIRNRHGVHLNGKLYQFPPRVIDWVSIKSIFTVIRLGLSFFWSKLMWITKRFDPETFESILVGKLGKHFFKMIIEPMTKKVWISAQYIDPSFAHIRFAQVSPFEVVKKLVFPNQKLNPSFFYYPRHGFQELWDRTAEYVVRDGQQISYETQPIRINVNKHRIEKITFKGPKGEYNISDPDMRVVSTIPIPILIRLLEGVEFKDRLLELSKQLKFRGMVLVAIELETHQALPYRTLIYPQGDISFNRLFEQNQYSQTTTRPGHSVIVADITLPYEDLNKIDDNGYVSMVLNDIKKLKYIDSSKIKNTHVIRVDFAYVVPDKQTRAALYEITHLLKKIVNLDLLGRFSVGEYDNSDYALDNGINLARMISGESNRLDFLALQDQNQNRPIVG